MFVTTMIVCVSRYNFFFARIKCLRFDYDQAFLVLNYFFVWLLGTFYQEEFFTFISLIYYI